MIQPLQGQLQKGCWLDLGYLGSNKKELKYTKKPSSFLWLVIHVSGLCDSTKLRCWVLNLAEWYFTSLFTPRSINCLRIAVVYPRTSSELVYPLPQNFSQSKIPHPKKKICLCSHHIPGKFPRNSPENSRGLALLRQHLLQKAQDPQLELWTIGTNHPWSGISSPVHHEFRGGGLCFLKPEDICAYISIYLFIYLFILVIYYI